MKRSWFRDTDGTFYRNCPLIEADLKSVSKKMTGLLFFRRSLERDYTTLEREWEHAFSVGVYRKDVLGKDDIEAIPLPMRLAYPNNPGLWALDARADS